LLNADFICVIASQGKMADAMGFSVAWTEQPFSNPIAFIDDSRWLAVGH
jgi:hypothetical protein